MSLKPYVRKVLQDYKRLPDTPNRVRPADRLLAQMLYHRRIPLHSVQVAFLLTTARRKIRPQEAGTLATIRSLHYFLPTLDEILQQPLQPGYIHYLHTKLHEAGFPLLPLNTYLD